MLFTVFSLTAIVPLKVLSQFAQENWKYIKCDEEYTPPNCNLDRIPLLTSEDFERCGPSRLPLFARNYFLGTAGRGLTYRADMDAYNRIQILPKMLRDIRGSKLSIRTLGQQMDIPIGLAPVGYQTYASPGGEMHAATAAAAYGTVMVISSCSLIPLEEIAGHVQGSNVKLWMQIYILKDRKLTVDLVKKAEQNGYEAIVLTVDSNVLADISCNARKAPEIQHVELANLPGQSLESLEFEIVTFKDIKWLKRVTKLPIVVKGILNSEDARMAIWYGASAIFVSDHGARQLDTSLAAVDVLPSIVNAAKRFRPQRDVYIDGGIRNGRDVFKAIARGAKMVFIGRPFLWALAEDGENGVRKILEILSNEFNQTMLLAGVTSPSKITQGFVLPPRPTTG